MQPNQLHCPVRGRRAAGHLALLILLTLVTLTAACPDPSSDNENQGVTNNNSEPVGGDDRPIIITGGSLDLQFNPNFYQRNGNVFRSANNRVTRMRVYDDDRDSNVLICEDTFGGDSSITVGYDLPAAANRTIAVTSTNVNAQPQVEVNFNTNDLPGRHNNNSRKFYNKAGRLRSLTYTGGANNNCAFNSNSNSSGNTNGNSNSNSSGRRMTIELEGMTLNCVMPTPTLSMVAVGEVRKT